MYPSDKDKTKPVSFRLPSNLYRLLAERAAEHAISPGLYARQLVRVSLLEDRDKLAAELETVQVELQEAKNNFKRGVLILLTDAGKCEIAEARRWVLDNLD